MRLGLHYPNHIVHRLLLAFIFKPFVFPAFQCYMYILELLQQALGQIHLSAVVL